MNNLFPLAKECNQELGAGCSKNIVAPLLIFWQRFSKHVQYAHTIRVHY